jgi:pimeloyl-ACP methyl ester carboxylesterase
MNSPSSLFVKTVGTGKPLVFLHGFLEDHTVWNPIYPEFVNEGFQCILIDLPCHGKTRFEGDVCTMAYMAGLVSHYLKENKIQNPFVFGHSMGGYAGLELLRLMEAKLTLVHSNFWADTETKKKDRNRVIEVVKKNKSLFLNEAIPNLFAPANREFRREEIALLIERANKLEAPEIAAATGGLRDRTPSYDLMEQHSVSIVQGSDDATVPNDILEQEVAKLTAKPSIYRIENCGHMSFIEQPAALINHLRTVVFQ